MITLTDQAFDPGALLGAFSRARRETGAIATPRDRLRALVTEVQAGLRATAVEPVLRAALQDIDLRGRPVIEQLLQAHHHRGAGRVEHIHVEAEADLQIGQLVEAFLEQFGIDIAALGHQHDADLFIAFIADILKD